MENLIKQISMLICRVDEENNEQTSRVVRDRKFSSRRTRSSKGDSWKGQIRSRRQLSRENDKTEGEEFRTAVASAAFVVSSMENKKREIKQDQRSNSGKTLSEMASNAKEGVYSLHRSKIIHLVRHAQGIHNVAGEKDHSAYMSETLFDAQLSHLGWEQVDNLRKHVHASGLFKNIELVVVSPLMRTMQTAVGAFGGEGCTHINDLVPLMVENTGNSNRPASSSLNCPPFIAVELCREHLGVHPCDRRRSITEYKNMFPAIDFSLIENDGDVLWTSDTREKNEDVAARGVKFMKWLLTREEKEIAVVSHSGFLFHTLGTYGDDCLPTLKKEMSKNFKNCELRSVVIVDRSMTGSNISKTDFPGKIPSGTDLPSDTV